MKAKKNNPENSLKDFLDALDEIQRSKGIDKEEIIQAVEAALVSAYKKDYKGSQSVRVEIDRETGETDVYAQRTVVEEVENETNEISIEEARAISLAYELGDIVEFKIDPMDFGRVAAQNAKQLILQRMKEAERNVIFDMYAEKKGELITGRIQRVERGDVYVALDRTEALMNQNNQTPGESYYPGMRLKVYISDVVKTNKGAQIYVSRSNPYMIRRLFEFEIPEIFDGTVEIMSLSREAGSRTKIAVRANDSEVDAVGACVGFRGTRIQNILNEIIPERIDVVSYSDDPIIYISNAINPAEAEQVIIDENAHTAVVIVDDSQLSLAIGKDGQNVRLAAKLTGWKIDIKSRQQYAEMNEATEIDISTAEIEFNENSYPAVEIDDNTHIDAEINDIFDEAPLSVDTENEAVEETANVIKE